MLTRNILCAAVLALATACAGEPAPPMPLKPEVVRSMQRYSNEYVLTPGDQIQVTIFRVPDLSGPAVIRPDGYVSLPALKEVKAAGLTVAEFDEYLTKRYAERLVEPDVTVAVTNPRAANVFVVGDVARPGPTPVRESPTVASAIANSGGLLRTASMSKVAVIRLGDDGYLTGYVMETPNWGESAFYMGMSDMLLKPGDVVVVPESGRSQFARFIQDFINTPSSGINNLLSPYFQFRILQQIDS